MNYKVITPVSTEPVTLAEVKEALKLDSTTFSGDISISQSISPGSHNIAASYSLAGSSVDVLGKIAIISFNSGACGTGGSVTAKIQESDDSAIWADYSGGAFTTITELNDNAIQEIDYTGGKQYIRVVATVAVAACSFSADVIVKSGEIAEDIYLDTLITAAREYCEDITGLALATQTIELYLDEFPESIELPKPPLQAVTSVSYKDYAGTETTNSDYIVDTDSLVGQIVLAYNKNWPSFTPYPVNPIKIRYVCGYTAIPKSLKQAMLLYVGYFYEHRSEAELSEATQKAIDRIVTRYKVRWF